MLCTSCVFQPSTHSTPPHSSPTREALHNVYVCTSSPAVVELWARWPLEPQLQTAQGTLHPVAAEARSATLKEMCASYQANAAQSGDALVQVLALGPHAAMCEEAKAAVAGVVTAALQRGLWRLLLLLQRRRDEKQPSLLGRQDNDSGNDNTHADGEEEEAIPLDAVRVVERCCRFTPAAAPAAVMAPATAVQFGSWRVTWLPQLVQCVADWLAAHREAAQGASTAPLACLTVHDCAAWVRASVEGGLRTRLMHSAGHSGGGAEPGEHDGSRGPLGSAMSVTLVQCAVAATHPCDVGSVTGLCTRLHQHHIRAAQESGEDGTEAFTALLQHSRQPSAPSPASQLTTLWGRAMDAYTTSARCAQQGLLYVLSYDTASCGASPLMPLSATEVRARTQAALTAITSAATQRLVDAVLAPVRVRTAGAYINHVLLTLQLSGDDETSPSASVLRSMEGDAAVAPARAAMWWRDSVVWPCGCHEEKAKRGVTQGKGDHPSHRDEGCACVSPLRSTPLQWALYTLRRQLVVAAANAAQVALTGDRLRLGAPPLSPAALRAHAERCIKAQALLRGLLQWHCPYPTPSLLLATTSAAAGAVAGTAELLWCLRMLAKLHVRAAALLGCAGDVAGQREQQRLWRDQLQRWRTRRSIAATAAGARRDKEETVEKEEEQEGSDAAWRTSVETVVCHVDSAAWEAFLTEVSSGPPNHP